MTAPALEWCSGGVFWGSHGCTSGEHSGDVHTCSIVVDGQIRVCCEMRPTGPETCEVRWGGQGDFEPYGPWWAF